MKNLYWSLKTPNGVVFGQILGMEDKEAINLIRVFSTHQDIIAFSGMPLMEAWEIDSDIDAQPDWKLVDFLGIPRGY
jgi:hypothetical protein